jgi:hypothetical protein
MLAVVAPVVVAMVVGPGIKFYSYDFQKYITDDI